MATAARTFLAFHHNAKLYRLKTQILSIRPFSALEETNQGLFKQASPDEDHVVVTKETVFHPQGGGQPSDEGYMTPAAENDASSPAGPSDPSFQVRSVRMDAVNDGQVLHVGRFVNGASLAAYQPGSLVEQAIDVEKRLLYSRFHTAGHVLGAAVRHLLESQIEGFDELKASHFPDNASCEFQGLIDGKWKPEIQQRVNDYVKKAMSVEIDFWTAEDFRKAGLERLIPDSSFLGPGEDKFRVVKIVGAETYPCGGTHVDTTDLCGETTVKKISRNKGMSKVSYTVASA
ncbi:Putative Alanyl-tRNA synthetase [[Torrubiella] hemipterigena]|uniref:Putative Alanyl-tRNA synthetase n=1 Tax=[Torrubiella] hemipterigena TaxID=1531966 RepID=A0A0A1TBB7_9HYPO|nr:Putative Alanyl-tRNA synthetase [[Torrubiella] hemipterigena]